MTEAASQLSGKHLSDFDWKANVTLASSTASSLQIPSLQVHFHSNIPGHAARTGFLLSVRALAPWSRLVRCTCFDTSALWQLALYLGDSNGGLEEVLMELDKERLDALIAAVSSARAAIARIPH